jgi:hypothetical protein
VKSVHHCLLEQYQEMRLPPPSERHRGEHLLAGLYGDGDRPLVALGLGDQSGLYLGTPSLVWSGPHTPDWSFKPVWPIPQDWLDGLNDEQATELLAQAKKMATRRKRQYRRCQDCGESRMPEHVANFHGKPTCHSCMARQGVVF